MSRRPPRESSEANRAILFFHSLRERSCFLPLRPLNSFRESLPPTARPAFLLREACLRATFLLLRKTIFRWSLSFLTAAGSFLNEPGRRFIRMSSSTALARLSVLEALPAIGATGTVATFFASDEDARSWAEGVAPTQRPRVGKTRPCGGGETRSLRVICVGAHRLRMPLLWMISRPTLRCRRMRRRRGGGCRTRARRFLGAETREVRGAGARPVRAR